MRWFVSLLGAALLLLVPVSGAAGHASLTSSDPADGTELAIAPAEVTLTFSEELLNELVEVSILDAAGDLVMATEAEQTPPPGTDVIVPWPADLPPGQYSVAFRVVSEDGHPVTGQVTFSYDDVAAPNPEPTTEPTTEPAVDPTPDSTPEESAVEQTPDATAATDSATATEPSPELIAAEGAGQPSNSLIGPLLIAGAVIIGVGVIISVVMLARSRQ
jgi:methionine-rich copper-binding protein CopC